MITYPHLKLRILDYKLKLDYRYPEFPPSRPLDARVNIWLARSNQAQLFRHEPPCNEVA